MSSIISNIANVSEINMSKIKTVNKLRIFIPFPRGGDGRGAPLNAFVTVRERNSSQANKLEREIVNESHLFTRVTSKTRRQMIHKFLHNLPWRILFVHLVFYWIRPEIGGGNRYILSLSTAFRTSSCKITQFSAQFAKKVCGERVNEKLQKIKRTFFYKLAKIQRNPAETT